MRRTLPILLGAFLFLAAAPAPAQVDGSDQATRARVEFDAGRDSLKQGDLQGALAHFRASLSLHASPGTLLNLASVEEKLGMFASATGHYQDALAVLPAGDERIAIAQARIKDIDPKVPTFRVQFQGTVPPGLAMTLDGKPLAAGAIDREIQADPGAHVLALSAPGREERRHEMTLHAGDKQTLVIPALTPIAPIEPPSATPSASAAPSSTAAPRPSASAIPTADRPSVEPAPGRGLRTAGFAVLGAGGAAAIAAGILGGLSMGRKQELDAACAKGVPRMCPPAYEPVLADGQSLANASTAVFAIAGAGLAVGVTLLVLGSTRGPVAPAAKVAVSPTGLVVQGRF